MSETDTATPERVTLEELKRKTPTELLSYAEGLEIENASSLRTQELLFTILKELADNDVEIVGGGVVGDFVGCKNS